MGIKFKDHLQKSFGDPKGPRGRGFEDSSVILQYFKKFQIQTIEFGNLFKKYVC